MIEAFSYDGTGNRLSRQTSGGTQTYGYALDSHQLTSIDAQTRSHDAMGSLTARGADAFVHDDRQRLAQAGDKVYGYNARGERTHKSGLVQPGGGSTLYIYDEAGRLISESYRSTTPYIMQRSYLWLDDRPVAVFAHTGAYANQWLHIHTDHLGTPRAITRPAANDTVVWRWDFTGSAFGDHAPQTDPDGDGTHFAFNLRFPGQYYDAESGLHYNYFRDYEAGTGRYIESDPIGLDGGLSTFTYAISSPLIRTDASGLSAVSRALPYAGGLVLLDGPVPVGDILAGGLLAGAIIVDICTDEKSREKCFRRYDQEEARCEMWRGRGPTSDPDRWYWACLSRAANRRNICYRNNGPGNDDPPEWSDSDMR